MAANSNASSQAGGSLSRRFTRKIGPLPVWAWAAIILAAGYLYYRTRSAGAAASTQATATPTTPDTTGATTGGAQVPSGGGGTPADNLNGGLFDAIGANTSALDSLAYQLQTAPVPDPGANGGPANDQPPPYVPVPVPVPAPQGHLTQTQTGVLHWGGVSFTTKKAFQQWAKAHGTSVGAIFKTHPAAQNIYMTLK